MQTLAALHEVLGRYFFFRKHTLQRYGPREFSVRRLFLSYATWASYLNRNHDHRSVEITITDPRIAAESLAPCRCSREKHPHSGYRSVSISVIGYRQRLRQTSRRACKDAR